MNVTVNDEAVVELPESADTFGDLLDGLREAGRIRDDEVVVAITTDAHRWSAEDMDALQEDSFSDVQELSIETADLRGYAERILTDAESMLRVLDEAAERVAATFRAGESGVGSNHLFNLLNALQRFLTCVVQVENACSLEHGLVGSASEALSELSDSLSAVQESQEQEDWTALADAIEQRLMPSFERIRGVLAAMREEL